MLPIFKNTEHAWQYGKSIEDNPQKIQELKNFRSMNLRISKKMMKYNLENEAFFLATGQSQLCREALEMAEKKGYCAINILSRQKN